jgi:hypothetical protein
LPETALYLVDQCLGLFKGREVATFLHHLKVNQIGKTRSGPPFGSLEDLFRKKGATDGKLD